MFKSFSRKIQSLWHSSPDMFLQQTIPMRYMNNEIIQKELDKILGQDGWEWVGVCHGSQAVYT